MIRISDLCHVYGPRTVLDVPSWEIADGAAALVIGGSGSGKSTLLHVLAGLLTPTRGRAEIDGVDFAKLKPGARDRTRGATVSIVFQGVHLLPALDVAGNLALAADLAGTPAGGDRVERLLMRLGLAHRAHAKPRELSGGEAQRAAIGRAVITRPKLLLADEPTAALDDRNAEIVLNLLREEAAQVGATMVVATHDKRIMHAFDQRLELETPA